MEMTSDLSRPSQPMSVVQRLLGVFTQPRAVFEELRERPRWLAPFIVLLVVGLVSSYFIMPIALSDQAQKISENESIPQERKAEILKQFEGGVTTQRQLISLGSVIGGSFLMMFFVGAVLMFGGNFLLGGSLRFPHAMALYASSNLVEIPGAILKVPMMVAKKSLEITVGPAAFLSPEAADSIGGMLLGRLDLFGLWRWALMTLGLAVLARTTVKRAATFTVPLWVFWTIAAIVMRKMTQGLSGF
jgi:hypothetical protein